MVFAFFKWASLGGEGRGERGRGPLTSLNFTLSSPTVFLTPPDPPPTHEVNSYETIFWTSTWRNIQFLILCRHNETDMLEELKKTILRGSLSSRIIINN